MFQPGTLVQQKSGGYVMTVAGPGIVKGSLDCHWVDDQKKPHSDDFPAAILKVAPDPASKEPASK